MSNSVIDFSQSPLKKNGSMSNSLEKAEYAQRLMDECSDLLDKCGSGLNAATAKSKLELMFKNVDSVTVDSSDLKPTDEVIGFKIHELICQMVNNSCVEVSTILTLNFGSTDFVTKRREGINKYSASLSDLNLQSVILDKPDSEDFRLEASAELRVTFDAEKREVHRKQAVEKISQDSQYGSTRQREAAVTEELKDHPYVFDVSLFNQHKLDMQYLWEAEYVKALKQFKIELAKQNKNNQERTQIFRLQTDESVVEQMVSGFVHIMANMMKKIRLAADKSEIVKSALNALVTLESTGQTLSQCYEKGHLAGIVQIVKNKYGKASLVTFRNELQDAMSFQMSEELTCKDPNKGVAQISARMSKWMSMKYWQYMTFDVFWSCILLSSMHPNAPLRAEAVRKVNDYIRELLSERGEEGLLTTDQSELPIFKKAVEVIDNWQSSAGMKSNHEGGADEAQETYKSILQMKSHQEAASAQGGEAVVLIMTKQIERSYGIEYALENGSVVAYTATNQMCSKCWTKPKIQGGRPERNEAAGCHMPRCCSNQCNKCKYYGHLKPHCAQKHCAENLKAPQQNSSEGYSATVTFEDGRSAETDEGCSDFEPVLSRVDAIRYGLFRTDSDSDSELFVYDTVA